VPVNDARLRQDFIPLLEEKKPPPVKEYSTRLPRVTLPDVRGSANARGDAVSGAQILSGKSAPDGSAVDLGDLSVILARCAGVKRKSARSGEYFRAVSSAGNRHPYELYVCANAIDGLPDGVWHYQPHGHVLTLIGPPPAGRAATLIVSGVPWRSCWRYAERGYRHVGWDCGTVASHALMAAAAQGLSARLEAAFDDTAVGRLIGARDREEIPMLLVPLGDSDPAVIATGDAAQGDLGAGVEEFPVVTAVHEAGNLRGPAEVASWREPRTRADLFSCAPGQIPEEATDEAFGALVDGRRSARRFDGSARISQAAARWIVEVASAAPPWDAGRVHDVRAVLHAADGMTAGVYCSQAGTLVPAGPSTREVTHRICLNQELGRDAAAVLFITPAPGPAVAAEARTYRAALLAAGFALGRAYLAAMALRLGCSGLTFVDSDLPATIGAPAAIAAVGIGRPEAVGTQ
jgi:nitroreductase